jgi:RNA polymerase-binding transcription factor DksA
MPNSKPSKPSAKATKPAKTQAAGAGAESTHPEAAHTKEPGKAHPKVHESGLHLGLEEPKVSLTPFLRKQRERLLQLRDNMLDSMSGVAKDTLRSRAEGSEASAFGMHQADAGSDAYDRDFALSLLSQEQDALYEIEQALKRIELGTYGVCEISGKPISHARLEAAPFTRYTVECQAQLEKQNRASRSRVPVTSLFGLTDTGEEPSESDEEETQPDSKD